MADSPGVDGSPAPLFDDVTDDEKAAIVMRMLPETRILEVPRTFPLIPSEKTVVFS